VGAAAAVVVLVLGDVGQMGEIREGAHDGDGLVAGQLLEHAVQFGAGLRVRLAPEAHCGLAHRLDHLEDFLAFLLAQHVAQKTAEQADVLLQRCVLVNHLLRRTRRDIRLSCHVECLSERRIGGCPPKVRPHAHDRICALARPASMN